MSLGVSGQMHRDPVACKRYPGAAWIPKFYEMAEKAGFRIVPGEAEPTDVENAFVVQEELNPHGSNWTKAGAHPSVLFCAESPIYAYEFYDEIERERYGKSDKLPHFPSRMLFCEGTEHLWFPSFDEADVLEPNPWDSRKLLCAVMANKHYQVMIRPPTGSMNWNFALRHQLHDERYLALYHLQAMKALDLYGHGWEGRAKPCEDKLATIREYQFCLAYENGSYPGYVTEKAIDCLVAGVIPIYRGAPDSDEYLPRKVYVDPNEFSSWSSLVQYLKSMSPETARDKIQAGRMFLRSDQGRKYRYHAFAERVLQRVIAHVGS